MYQTKPNVHWKTNYCHSAYVGLIVGIRLVRPSEPKLGESYFDSCALLHIVSLDFGRVFGRSPRVSVPNIDENLYRGAYV